MCIIQHLDLNLILLNFSAGPVETNIAKSFGFVVDDELLKKSIESIPLKRIGQPDDIANLVSFLASDDAISITGSNIVNDSGSLL